MNFRSSMKNVIKIITILGIVTSLSPVYSMEGITVENAAIFPCSIRKEDLKKINPLSNTNRFATYSGRPPRATRIFNGNRLLTDEGLVLRLAAQTVLQGWNLSVNNSEILEKIGAAVSKGVLLYSEHDLPESPTSLLLEILPVQNPLCKNIKTLSVFQNIENFFIEYILRGNLHITTHVNNKSLAKQELGLFTQPADLLLFEKKCKDKNARILMKPGMLFCMEKL